MLIGLPILRLRGVYFAMVTLVLTEVARLLALALPITNGAKGMVNIPLPGAIRLFGLTLVPDFATLANPRHAFYLVAVTLMVLCFAGLYRLVHSRIGRLCLSLQQNEELASSIGVNVAYLRVIAYAISSFLGGIGGAMFVAISQSIYPSSFTVTDSINFMLNCFLGGLGYVLGPMVGTFVLYFGWDLLFQTGAFQLLIYSSVLIVLMLVLPNGLLSLARRVGRKAEHGGAARGQIRLTKRFGGLVAVNDVSFAVREGEILSVIGPNGAGKSTLFKLIASFLRPTAGEVLLRGERISDLAPHIVARMGVVRTFQETTIFKGMSVRDNVIIAHHLRSRASLLGFFLGTRPLARTRPTSASSADEILAFLGLGAIARRAGEHPAARPSARARHRHRARHQPEDPAARRAVRRHEPRRDDAGGGTGARRARARRHHPPGRARHAGRDEDLRPHRRAELRREDRGRHARRDPAKPEVIEAYLGSEDESIGL